MPTDTFANGKVFCRVATGGDSMPTINWGSVTPEYSAFIAIQVVSFSGPTAPDCATMLDGSAAISGPSGVWPTPALTVTTDNDLIIAFGSKRQDYDPVDFSPIGCPTQINDAQIAVYTQIAAYYPQIAACYHIQTTETSVGPEAFYPTHDHSEWIVSVVFALKQQDISLPSWNSEPVITKVDTNTLRATLSASTVPPNTVRCGAWPKATAKPSAADVAGGVGAHGAASAAATGSSQQINIDVTDNPPFPAYRVFCVEDAGEGNYSDVPNASDVCLDPPTGFVFVACPSGLSGITTTNSIPQLYNDAPFTNVPYDTKTSNFTVDKVLIDQTSGAWGFIRADSGSNLIVDVRNGTFANNDVLVDNAGGAALVNGSPSTLSPRIALGDILVEPVGVSPGSDGHGCPGSMHPSCLVFDTEGSFYYTAIGRQRFVNGLAYHAASASYLPIDIDTVVNNHSPAPTTNLAAQVMTVGQAYSINLNTLFTDADGDSLEYAWISGALSPLTLNGATGVFSGTPGAEVEAGVDLQFVGYDSWGDVGVQSFKAVPITSWPIGDCVGLSLTACITQIRSQTFNSVSILQTSAACSATAAQSVLSQAPVAGMEVAPGDTVTLVASAGHARRCAAALRDQGE